MSDLIERIRDHAADDPGCPYLNEAADEIDRLRRELAEARGLLWEAKHIIIAFASSRPEGSESAKSLRKEIDRIDAFLTKTDRESDGNR